MRSLVASLGVLVACKSAPPAVPVSDPVVPVASQPDPARPQPPVVPAVAAPEVMSADTPRTTTLGASFIAPLGWSVVVRGPATLVTAPEGDSTIAFVDVAAKDAETAVAQAWAAYKADAKWPLKSHSPRADRDGWVDQRSFIYETSPNERRDVSATVMRRGDTWTVAIYDVSHATGEKRSGQIGVLFSRLLPKGYKRESFAGKQAAKLDAKKLAELAAFVDQSRDTFGVPGISIGIIQDGKVVLAEGYGVRELGKPAKVDADTLYMIASNTKALTTLLLATLVDANKLTWETPVTQVMPTFKLGDADTTKSVLVKHLVCACTGLPRQDFEWLFEFKSSTASSAMAVLGTMQPTTKFGELFQYSNPLAAAGGFVAGYALYPKKELGAAYDTAMQTRVFAPLGMTNTTFDYARAQRGNHAGSYGLDVDGKPAPAAMEVNYSIISQRPAGAAWSNVRDVLKYVAMELAKGALPNGKRFIGEAALLARRAPQVALSTDATYGMGLMVDTEWGTPVVHHGGDMIGYHSDMLWMPEHGVGAVILTNGDAGYRVRGPFRRKLLELMFDGEKLADAGLAASAKMMRDQIAADRARLTIPPAPEVVGNLAAKYSNPALGDLAVVTVKGTTMVDVGEWKSAIATRKNPDATTTILTITPGVEGFELVPGTANGKRTLITRDSQHEYVFTEK